MRAEGKRRRKIKRDCDHRQANQIGADEIEVVNQRVGNDAAQQAFGRESRPASERVHGSSPIKPERNVISSGRADRLGVRRADRPRTKPAQRVHRQENRNQESRDAEELQRQVGDESRRRRQSSCAPAARRRSGRGVQRRVERRVRNQCEDKEDREDEHQEADQLIEPPVGRRSECA